MQGPGRYRRAFDWRLATEDKEDTRIATEGLVALFRSEIPEILEDYLDVSRKRRGNHLALAKLQAHLIDDLIMIEGSVKHYRTRKSELEHALSKAASSKQEVSENEELALVRREIFLYKAYANAIRSIADGVAWRALGHDRAVLCALCQNRGSQQIGSQGTVEELREWSRQFDHGRGIAILNSLTNCLTYGDITLVLQDGSVEIIEVKRSKTTSNRVVRQKQKLREVVTFLSGGKGKLEGKSVEVCTLDIIPENGLGIVNDLLQEAGKTGFAAARVSNCAYVECIDARVATDEQLTRLVEERKLKTEEWAKRGDDVHDGLSLECLAFGPNLAPFSIFPFQSAACINLLTGATTYRVLLNVSAVGREFEYRGWQVIKTPRDMFESSRFSQGFMIVKKGGFQVILPPAAFMRMQMELLRPQVLIQQCELIRNAGPLAFDSEFNLPIYEHEAEVWD